MRVLARNYSLLSLFSVAVVLLFSANANANVIPIAVSNGSFETLAVSGASNQLGYHVNGGSSIQQVTGWTNGTARNGNPGYNFVFTGSTTNSSGQYGNAYGDAGTLGLWASQNGVSNGIGPSPDGGNFLAMDGVYDTAGVYTTLSGLTVGMDTKVYFYYAGAQQFNFDGPTTEAFQVSLTDGSSNTTESHSTAVLSNTSHGFTGWHYTYLDFTPTSTSETLTFLAMGTPSGVPPFSLLDGISVVQVTPEPGTLALLGTGIMAVGGLVRRRRRSI